MTEKQKYELHKRAIDTVIIVKAYLKNNSTLKSVAEENDKESGSKRR